MPKQKYPNFDTVLNNCIDRGCTSEQLQDFIDRTRQQHMDNPEMIRIIDDLEIKHITPMAT